MKSGGRFRSPTESGSKKQEKQEGVKGQWQLESPAREYLEQVKCCRDTECNERMMKKGFSAFFKMEIGKNMKTRSEEK